MSIARGDITIPLNVWEGDTDYVLILLRDIIPVGGPDQYVDYLTAGPSPAEELDLWYIAATQEWVERYATSTADSVLESGFPIPAGWKQFRVPGCEIGNSGWKFAVEALYNPNYVRRFGSDLFGDFNFGNSDGSGGGATDWVDWSPFVSDCRIQRGLREPNVNQQTDELRFAVYDPDGELMRWIGQPSLASPNIGTPMRMSLIDPSNRIVPLATARVNQISERHGATAREIEFLCLGTKTELRTDLLPQLLPQQSIADRIDDVRTQIQLPDPFEPYPPAFFTEDLARDPVIREGDKTDAYFIVQESAASAGYVPFTTRSGSIGWAFIGDAEAEPSSGIISDCTGNGEIAVATSQFWSATDQAILNVVQVWGSDIQFSGEAIDPASVARFGRRSRGFGFPIYVANKDKSSADLIAASILERTKNRVNRVSQIEFHTLSDQRWLDVLFAVDIGTVFDVQRTAPFEGTILASVIGYDLAIDSAHIEGVFHTSTPHETI